MKRGLNNKWFRSSRDTANRTVIDQTMNVLRQRLREKGLGSIETQRFIKDAINTLSDREIYSQVTMNRKMERLGWENTILDRLIFDLIHHICDGGSGRHTCYPY